MMPILHEHPFASYCWKALIALYERDLPFERHLVVDELTARPSVARVIDEAREYRHLFPLPWPDYAE